MGMNVAPHGGHIIVVIGESFSDGHGNLQFDRNVGSDGLFLNAPRSQLRPSVMTVKNVVTGREKAHGG
jgi:hypothetical protein